MTIKKTVIVTIEKEIELHFPDNYLSDQFLEDWRSCMNKYDDINDIIKAAAYLVASDSAEYDNDGFGRMVGVRYGTIPEPQTEENTIKYEVNYEDYDYDILKGE